MSEIETCEQAKAPEPKTVRAQPRSLSCMAWRRFCRRRLALLGVAMLLPLLLMLVAAPKLAPYDPTVIDMERFEAPPSSQHLLGTDVVGRDVLSRLVFGARVSLSVGLVAVSINTIVSLAEKIGGITLTRHHDMDAPQGVAGRNSDNTFIQEVLSWQPDTPLEEGLAKTYKWIEKQYNDRKAGLRTVS